MDADRTRVLRMVQEGVVSPQDGARLLEALATRQRPRAAAGAERKLRIRIEAAGADRIDVAVPIGLARLLARFLPAPVVDALEDQGLSIEDLPGLLDRLGGEGPMQVVDAVADGARIQVLVQ